MLKKIQVIWATPEDRNLMYNIIFAFLVKGLSLMVSMFSMPLYIRYFSNTDVLGVWYTVLSILSWVSILDLGLGNGLRNYFTVAFSNGDIEKGRKYIISTYIAMALIIIPVLFIGCICILNMDMNSFFKVSRELIDKRSLTSSLVILFCGVGINFVLKTINSVIYAIQKSSINNTLALISSILPLIYVSLSSEGTMEENMIRLSVVHVIGINLPLVVATIVIFKTKCKDYFPRLYEFEWSTAKTMVSIGLKFFFAELFFLILMSTNEVLIVRLFSAEYVVEYSIYYKIFMVLGSMFMLALTPLWSKVTEDFSKKRYKKIKETNRVLYVIAGGAIVANLCLIFFLQDIVNVWLKEDAIEVHLISAIVFAVFGGFYIFNIVLTTVANGIGELRTQVIAYGIGVILKIPILQLLKDIYDSWVIVIAYNSVVLCVFCIFQLCWVEKRINKLIVLERD